MFSRLRAHRQSAKSGNVPAVTQQPAATKAQQPSSCKPSQKKSSKSDSSSNNSCCGCNNNKATPGFESDALVFNNCASCDAYARDSKESEEKLLCVQEYASSLESRCKQLEKKLQLLQRDSKHAEVALEGLLSLKPAAAAVSQSSSSSPDSQGPRSSRSKGSCIVSENSIYDSDLLARHCNCERPGSENVMLHSVWCHGVGKSRPTLAASLANAYKRAQEAEKEAARSREVADALERRLRAREGMHRARVAKLVEEVRCLKSGGGGDLSPCLLSGYASSSASASSACLSLSTAASTPSTPCSSVPSSPRRGEARRQEVVLVKEEEEEEEEKEEEEAEEKEEEEGEEEEEIDLSNKFEKTNALFALTAQSDRLEAEQKLLNEKIAKLFS